MPGKRTSKNVEFKRVISKFYEEYAPEKVDDVGKVLEHFGGREDDLIDTLEKKYSVRFHRDGSFEDVFNDSNDDSEEYDYESGDDDAETMYVSDEDLYDSDLEEQANFAMKTPRQQQADLASAAALIAKARPKLTKTPSQKKNRGSKRDSKRGSKRGVLAPAPTPMGKAKPRGESKASRASRSSRNSKGSGTGGGGRSRTDTKSNIKANRRLKGSAAVSVREKAEHLSKKGTLVWVRDAKEAWAQGTIADARGDGMVNVRVGRHKTVVAEPADVEPVLADKETLHRVKDLTKLPALHEPALLQALQDRFDKDKIYTFTGPILLAVNPFKRVDIYGAKQAAKYAEASKGFRASEGGGLHAVDLAPHVYKLADDAYRSMRDKGGANQSILVSGESGAGKTETTKIVLNYLSYVSGVGHKKRRGGGPGGGRGKASGPAGAGSKAKVADRLLRANPVLEAFGNAKTIRNDNSSRFGKFIQLQFDENKGGIQGAYVETYLLEKARVVHQGAGERNYHIFYELAAGASPEQKRRWQFPKALKHCRYTGQSGTMQRSDIDDLAQFQNTVGAMEVLNFSPSDMEKVFKAVVAVLHLGNVDYKQKTNSEGMPEARVCNHAEAVAPAAALLDVDPAALEDVLTKRRITVSASETLVKPLGLDDAENARDALAMNVYERLFGWVVWRTNLSIGMDDKQYEGLLARQEQLRQYEERRKRRGEHNSDDEDDDDRNAEVVVPVALSRAGAAATASAADKRASLLRGPAVRESLNRAFAQALSMGGKLGKKSRAGPGGTDSREARKEHLIGCLDIFGFEVFETNSFEQLCINYTNEQLQQQFNEFVFSFEQQEYAREGIDWQFVSFPDNSECIEMIEARPIGLLALIDEECLYPRGSDGTLLVKMHSHLAKKFDQHFIMSNNDKRHDAFTVRHFAGDVQYSVRGFCAKNKNELRQEAVDLVRSSGDRLVSCLMPANAARAAGGADMAAHFDALLHDSNKGARQGRASIVDGTLGPGRGGARGGGAGAGAGAGGAGAGSKILKTTVGSHFKAQLAHAMAAIRTSDPHYVRCLKPNDANKAGKFDRVRMVGQLRYSGVLELVRVTRAGYPSRFPLGDFVGRFAVLLHSSSSKKGGSLAAQAKQGKELAERGNRAAHVKACQKICDNARLVFGDDYQIGLSKMFLRQATLAFLEMKRAERTFDCVVTIQRAFRRFRGEFRKRYGAVVVQRNVRGFLVRKEVDSLLEQRVLAAEIIQGSPYFQRWLDFVMRKSRADRRRKRRKARDKRRQAARRAATASPLARLLASGWYNENREVLFWAAPLVALYVVPNVIGLVSAFFYNAPAIPVFALLLAGGMFAGSFAVDNLLVVADDADAAAGAAGSSPAARARARRARGRAGLARGAKGKAKAKAKPKPKAKRAPRGKARGARRPTGRAGQASLGASSRSKRAARGGNGGNGGSGGSGGSGRVAIPKSNASAKFTLRAAKLRQEKASNKQAKRRSQTFEMPAGVDVKIAPRYRGLHLGRNPTK